MAVARWPVFVDILSGYTHTHKHAWHGFVCTVATRDAVMLKQRVKRTIVQDRLPALIHSVHRCQFTSRPLLDLSDWQQCFVGRVYRLNDLLHRPVGLYVYHWCAVVRIEQLHVRAVSCSSRQRVARWCTGATDYITVAGSFAGAALWPIHCMQSSAIWLRLRITNAPALNDEEFTKISMTYVHSVANCNCEEHEVDGCLNAVFICI